jgi:hypothetical protein
MSPRATAGGRTHEPQISTAHATLIIRPAPRGLLQVLNISMSRPLQCPYCVVAHCLSGPFQPHRQFDDKRFVDAASSARASGSIGVAVYNPRTGNYLGPDGHLYSQADLAKPAGKKSWKDLILH